MLGKPPITAKGSNSIPKTAESIAERSSPVQLPSGRVIRAKVLKQLNGGRVLILFNGRKIEARTDLTPQTTSSLRAGKNHLFFVKKSTNEVVLKLLPPSQADAQEMIKVWNATEMARQRLTLLLKKLNHHVSKGHLCARSSFSEEVKALNSFIPSLFLDLTSANRASQLKKIILRLGLFWEAKVADGFQEGKVPDPGDDLKALLHLVAPKLDKEGEKECQQLLGLIEQQQQITLKAHSMGQWFFFFVPIYQDQDLEPASIYIKKDENWNGLKIVLHLGLSNLGRMEVIVFLPIGQGSGDSGAVDVAVGVETEEAKIVIEQGISSLDNSLRKLGFSLRSFQCEVMDSASLVPPMLFYETSGPIVDVLV